MSLTPIFDQLRTEHGEQPEADNPTRGRSGLGAPRRLASPTGPRTDPMAPASSASGGVAFDADTVHVVDLAQQEAHALGHRYYGTEHLLLALICSGQPAGQLLLAAGAALPALRRAAATFHQPTAPEPSTGRGRTGEHHWTAAAASVFAAARRHARHHGAHEVDSGHLLAALLEPGHGLSAALLLAVGVDPDTITACLRSHQSIGESRPATAGDITAPLPRTPGQKYPDQVMIT